MALFSHALSRSADIAMPSPSLLRADALREASDSRSIGYTVAYSRFASASVNGPENVRLE